jgi:hypothetical protein
MKRVVFLALGACVLFFTIALGKVQPTMPEGEKNAYFGNSSYRTTVRAYTPETWIFTVCNCNCSSSDNGEARFFLKFYVDGECFWNEYDSTTYKTWRCDRGTNVTWSYAVQPWNVIQPATRYATIELYWLNGNESRLEDTVSFTIDITIPVTMQHVQASSYLAIYLILCFLALSYYYTSGLDLKEERKRALE